MNLVQRLISLAQQKKLAHFYILEPTKNSADAQAQCEAFCAEFFKQYFKDVGSNLPDDIWNHPDVLTLGNRAGQEEISNNFTVDEALQFMRYFEFAPVSAPHKFAVITEAHRITTIVANKWLKLLEEPNSNCTIILINSSRLKLLDTIQSRGVLLRLENPTSHEDEQEFLNFIHESQKQSLSEFIEKNQKGSRDLNYWIGQLISWEAQELSGAEAKNNLGKWLNQMKEMEAFHQPSATKWSLFYQYLQSNVFGRLIH